MGGEMENRKRILICDDEEGVRESLNLILEDSCTLDFATTGAEAIEKIKNSDFDGVLLDIKMPTKDGLETLEEIKKIDPGIKVIIVTGYQSVETASRAVKLGAIDYITKPLESSEVKEKVGKI
jgi:DNA-binding NtrC family response regulator